MVNLSASDGQKDSGPPKPQEDIIFTVDEDIFEKVGVKRPRKGEELGGMEAEKLYKYQLKQDKEKIIEKYGTYTEKVAEYHNERMQEVTYATFHLIRPLGHRGNFNESANVARELSWRDTSLVNKEVFGIHLQTPPEIAGKRYKEWLTGKPKGPSKEYLKDKAQRKQDKELWEDIKFARLEKTRNELREESKQRSLEKARARKAAKEALKAKNKAKNAEKNANAMKLWKKERIDANDFTSLRLLPTKSQSHKSMLNWDAGHQNDWNYDNGYPQISQSAHSLESGVRMSHAMVNTGELNLYEGVHYTSGEYFQPGDELDREFIEYTVDLNYKKAVVYLAQAKKEMKRRERARKKAEAEEKYNRKRAGIMSQEDLALDALQAKTMVAMNSGAYKPKGTVQQNNDDDDDLDEEEKEEKREAERKKKEKEKAEEEEEERDLENLRIDEALWLLEHPPIDEADEVFDVVDNSINWQAMDVITRKKMALELSKPYSFSTISRKAILASRNITANNIRIVKKKASRNIERGSKYIAYQFHPFTIKRRMRYMAKCRCLKKAAPIVPEEDEDEVDEIGKKKVKKNREWEKYTEEDLEGMNGNLDSKDRKRLKAMKKRDLEQDATEAAEAAGSAGRAAAIAKKRAAELERQELRNPIIWIYRKLFPKKKAMSDLERRRAEAKKASEKMMKEQANEEKAMEMLFLIREKQRAARGLLDDVKGLITGKDSGASTDVFSVDDLIRFSRMGDYNSVIDIMDHVLAPIGPNETNSDGVSAFFTVLEMTLMNEAAESNESLFNDGGIIKRITQFFKKRKAAGKLDLVMKCLAYKGGNVNFLKQDKDQDGEAILHMAAHHGGNDMINWLHRKGANFSLCTSTLKRTPLMYAARANKVDTVMNLLKLGSMVTINAKDRSGWTALHFACSSASPELVTVLLICGADQYARNNRGTLPIDEAMGRARTSVVEAVRMFKKPDLEFRQQLAFMEIHYLDGIKEEAPELGSEDEDDDDDDDDNNVNDNVDDNADANADGGGEEKDDN